MKWKTYMAKKLTCSLNLFVVMVEIVHVISFHSWPDVLGRIFYFPLWAALYPSQIYSLDICSPVWLYDSLIHLCSMYCKHTKQKKPNKYFGFNTTSCEICVSVWKLQSCQLHKHFWVMTNFFWKNRTSMTPKWVCTTEASVRLQELVLSKWSRWHLSAFSHFFCVSLRHWIVYSEGTNLKTREAFSLEYACNWYWLAWFLDNFQMIWKLRWNWKFENGGLKRLYCLMMYNL